MSNYFLSLAPEAKSRYLAKISLIDNYDPYTLTDKNFNIDLNDLPEVSLMEIIIYFAVTNSYITGEQLRSYKSLEAYKYCEAGFVIKIECAKIKNNFVVLGEVKHSQRMNAPNLIPWIILMADGSIANAHCNCMAGLGEVCSHAAALAFALFIRSDEELACTDKLCTWNAPKITVGPKKMKDINWGKTIKSYPKPKGIPALEGKDLLHFLHKVDKIQPDAAILRVVQPFAAKRTPELFLPEEVISNLPMILSSLYDPKYKLYTLDELRGVEVNLNVTNEEKMAVCRSTLKQSKCKLWFEHRQGRITASTFKKVCCTSINNPSITVIKAICYPAAKTALKIKSLMYGLKYEDTARQAYEKHMKCSDHINVSVESTGLVISTLNPEFGASVDGLVYCECCGYGCLEIKAPYRMRDKLVTLHKFSQMKDSFILHNNDDTYSLKRNHDYFYQVQLQMYCLERNYCDFVVWSKQQMFIERIFIDLQFLESNLLKALTFHGNVIVPELLSRYYTELKGDIAQQLWCNCCQPDDGRDMIQCSNEMCPIQWFHIECVDPFNALNDVVWLCASCQQTVFQIYDTKMEYEDI